MKPDTNLMKDGLAHLMALYQRGPVQRITAQRVNGLPAYVMHGLGAAPAGLPGVVHVGNVPVPIYWDGEKPVHKGIVRAQPAPNEKIHPLWHSPGAKFTPRPIRVFQPGSETINTQMDTPKADMKPLQVALDLSSQEHGWWDKPLEMPGIQCASTYGNPYMLLQYVVPQDYCLYIDSWSFFPYCNVPVGWEFNVQLRRDGDPLVSYDEVVVDPLNPDPSLRCLFAGSTNNQTMVTQLRIDRNQTFTVVITPKGLYPFLNGSSTVCGSIGTVVNGHITALLDNRDGWPRPRDVGWLRDDPNGTATLEEVTEEDVAAIQAWVTGASANADPDVSNAGLGDSLVDDDPTSSIDTGASSLVDDGLDL